MPTQGLNPRNLAPPNNVGPTFAGAHSPLNQVMDMVDRPRSTISQETNLLSNYIGPEGENLLNSDPYNTTVFVGGLSSYATEETLKTYFSPFGDIHYVRPSL